MVDLETRVATAYYLEGKSPKQSQDYKLVRIFLKKQPRKMFSPKSHGKSYNGNGSAEESDVDFQP